MSETKGTILVTGANGGLGSAIVQRIVASAELARYHGLYAVRSDSSSSCSTLKSILASAADNVSNHDVIPLDLSSLDSVRRTAASINARVAAGEIPPIRVLILNAGLQEYDQQHWLSEEEGGLDLTFAANYLGHWLLTLLLLQSMDKERGRIVVIGSQSHDTLDKRNYSSKAFVEEPYKAFVHDPANIEAITKGTWSPTTEDPFFRAGFRRYGASKLFLVMIINSLQARLDRDAALNKICVLGVDPGTMTTGLQRDAPWIIRVLLFRFVYPLMQWMYPNGNGRSTDRSAGDVLTAAFDNGPGIGKEPKGVYLLGAEPFEMSEEARDATKRQWVWDESVKLTGLKDDETVLTEWR
ncbi:putative short-chain dehydrogenase [Coniella lustricola]|uniref:Putative short-chain dehydrogenase n=1 Tax=Coniella lustricola TaxID=2025994 RepID=A0A2T3ABA5_9PEZI|nr:putative short-chain dehydrogenase [Coniella lustricola]